MQTVPVTADHPLLRLLGRMDPAQSPLCLDWTASGLEFRLRGSDVWAELEAPEKSPIFYMIVLSDGCPVCRFPVEPGIRFYPLILGMEADKERTVISISHHAGQEIRAMYDAVIELKEGRSA